MPLKKLAQILIVKKDLVYKGTRPFMPPRKRRNAIERAHETHAGIVRTRKLFNLRSWWQRMSLDIESYVNACAKCNEFRPRVIISSEHGLKLHHETVDT